MEPFATWALIAVALALPCSFLALAGTLWAMLRSRGPRMAQFERGINTGLGTLADRLTTLESNLGARLADGESVYRSLHDEAQEAFRRSRAERKRTELAAARLEAGEERRLEVETPEEPATSDPKELRRRDLALVRQRLGG